jgi:uncharacterized glyoxalase superfamily protein PhnB
MTDEARHAAPRPIFTSIAAQLFVTDVKASSEFFTQKLGFAIDFIYGDPPFYGQVSRDHARFAMRQAREAIFVGDVREREHLISAAITVATADEIKQLFLSYQSEGVRFHQPLKDEPWGAQNFIVLDLDGNLILFAGPAEG